MESTVPHVCPHCIVHPSNKSMYISCQYSWLKKITSYMCDCINHWEITFLCMLMEDYKMQFFYKTCAYQWVRNRRRNCIAVWFLPLFHWFVGFKYNNLSIHGKDWHCSSRGPCAAISSFVVGSVTNRSVVFTWYGKTFECILSLNSFQR